VKILRLEIHNIRGIKEASIAPNGENFVIWGPNGSGKSAVVDAIDFLFTGKIARLIGEGTAGVTLAKHGPHIDHVKDPSQSFVSAEVEVPDIDGAITLKRSMGAPDALDVQGADISHLEEILNLTATRQHSLSRREILRYIVAQANKRSSEIQALLRLEELEATRKAIGKTRRQAKTGHTSATQALSNAELAIKDTLGLDVFSEDAMLHKINDLRSLLGGASLARADANNLKADISAPPPTGVAAALNPNLLQKQLLFLQTALKNASSDLPDADSNLRCEVEAIDARAQGMKDYTRTQLITLGISLLDDSGECPLCGWQWDPEELASNLSERAANAQAISEIIARVNEKAATISTAATSVKQSVQRLADAAQSLGLVSEERRLRAWAVSLSSLVTACAEPLKNYPPPRVTSAQIACLCVSPELERAAGAVVAAAQKAVPTVTPEQTAWDTLTTLAVRMAQWQTASKTLRQKARLLQRADHLYAAFGETREKELEHLYGAIDSRFSELYRCLHGQDEDGFRSRLDADGRFEVDFYGRGLHPPMALHSEGHQDSMGICLYLALAEHLTRGKVALTVLDDVVMSVDSFHRRQICTMLKQHFPERQFLITTHDKTWARQLYTEGVAGRNNCIEFTRWTLNGGPCVESEVDLWDRIELDLAKQDIPSAAFRLRNGSERFFEHLCDALRAPVLYKLNGRWDLGDYMDGAISRFKTILGRAKASAQSWGNRDLFDTLTELETVTKQILQRTGHERWMVNAAVHFNKWHELSEPDFRPIVEAFRDLFALFRCQSCGGLIRISQEQHVETSVRCPCQTVNWNLVKKQNPAR